MTKQTSQIDWSQISSPLPVNSFERYLQQSIVPPLASLGIDEDAWLRCRSLALALAKDGFLDPISILYTSFKCYYSPSVTLAQFTRWFLSDDTNKNDFPTNYNGSSSLQTAAQLSNLITTLPSVTDIDCIDRSLPIEQIWFFISISIRVPTHGYVFSPEVMVLDNNTTRLLTVYRKSPITRCHCFFAVTPSGRYSNQLYVCKPGRYLKVDYESNSFARVVQSANGCISSDHLQQWLEDFLAQYATKNSALLIDPRTTLLKSDIRTSCEKSSIQLITTGLTPYLSQILSPVISLFDKQCAEANRIDKMHFKSVGSVQRIIYTTWFALRTLKQNDQMYQLFNKTLLWKDQDQQYFQSLQIPPPPPMMKIKKKKPMLVKTGVLVNKIKLASTVVDPLLDSAPGQIFSYIVQRQMSIARASKLLGGMKLDYFKYCLSKKVDVSTMTNDRLLDLNRFMQSKSTVDWLGQLRRLHFWPCAKQLFLREIYRLTGIIAHQRSMIMCGNTHLGSLKSCDQQSPPHFWQAFEQIHGVQPEQESVLNDQQWNDDFQKYLVKKQLHHDKTQLWTVDAFEFPMTKKSTVLQLPDWNESRPMNSTTKVTVLYAFSNDGQSTEPCFIFPEALRSEQTIPNEHDTYNESGHITPSIFLAWAKNNLVNKEMGPMILVFCSRFPVLSATVLSFLEEHQIYAFGYPYMRTLPFRYLFERRVRNNRSTNLISELWKRTLLDQQRTHVLKGVLCTVTIIKEYFQQIWPMLIAEKRDDDEEPLKSFKEKCRQAFEQANIDIKPNSQIIESRMASMDNDLLIDQLNHLLNVVQQMKEHIQSPQVLKIKNDEASPCPSVEARAIDEAVDSSPTTAASAMDTSTMDKRSSDENDEPRSFKRLRSSCSQSNDSQTTTTHLWIPPSKQQISRLQSQSSSLFQFLLLLVHTILTTSQQQLTDEQNRWLHSTVHLYDEHSDSQKVDILIETACTVVKTNLVR